MTVAVVDVVAVVVVVVVAVVVVEEVAVVRMASRRSCAKFFSGTSRLLC